MDWKTELECNIRTVDELKKHLKLSKREEKQFRKVVKIHPMNITRYYLSLIDKSDKKDPIRKLIVPSEQELDLSGSYDTSGEKQNTKKVGLQHKYEQTALILSTSRCAAYCRHCFRKRLVGLPNKEILNRFNSAINYIKEHKEINNVLVTGGDPLVLPTKIIKTFLERLSEIKHLDFIRFGSRIPVAFPERIINDPSLFRLFKKYSTKKRRIYVVTHFNHPREITEKSVKAIDKLIQAGVIINNQTVLMKGVNDNPSILAELLNKLAAIGINPYYVFQCRPVKRVKAHFQVPLSRGYKIVEEARKRLNGVSKRFRYVMSHRTGKIEIVGVKKGRIYFKYHQAKHSKNAGRFFSRKLNQKAGWVDELK